MARKLLVLLASVGVVVWIILNQGSHTTKLFAQTYGVDHNVTPFVEALTIVASASRQNNVRFVQNYMPLEIRSID